MIYCVEDDSGIRDLMVYALDSAGFESRGFVDGSAFFEALAENRPELVMLDIMLPGEDGIEILKRLRANPDTETIPVIMATAKGSEYDKVLGLDLGADDYLAKPFGMLEMVSRVKAVLRRANPRTDGKILRIGNLTMSLKERMVRVGGERVRLTFKEFEILKLFMSNPGIVFTREHLLQSVWGSDFFGETRTVDVHIGTLRTKLGECGGYIETVRGVGYRMEAEQ